MPRSASESEGPISGGVSRNCRWHRGDTHGIGRVQGENCLSSFWLNHRASLSLLLMLLDLSLTPANSLFNKERAGLGSLGVATSSIHAEVNTVVRFQFNLCLEFPSVYGKWYCFSHDGNGMLFPFENTCIYIKNIRHCLKDEVRNRPSDIWMLEKFWKWCVSDTNLDKADL